MPIMSKIYLKQCFLYAQLYLILWRLFGESVIQYPVGGLQPVLDITEKLMTTHKEVVEA